MPMDEHYQRDADFPSNHEELTGSEVPVNAFVAWEKLRFVNQITEDTDDILGEERLSTAGVELNLPFDTVFSLFMVHGINSVDQLVCWLFVNREMAETFKDKELTAGVIWEIKDIHLESARDSFELPNLIDIS